MGKMANFRKILEETQNGQYELISDYIGRRYDVTVRCKKCGNAFTRKAVQFMYKNGNAVKVDCPNCEDSHSKLTTEGFQLRLDRLNGEDVYKAITEYLGASKEITIQHECGEVLKLKQASYAMKKPFRCPMCDKGSNMITTDIFKRKVFNKYGDDYTILGEYQSNTTKILVRHNICGREFEIEPYSLLRGKYGCQQCGFQAQRLTKEEVLQRISDLHDNIVVLSDYLNVNSRAKCKCTICNHEWETSFGALLKGTGCPNCAIYNKLEIGIVDDMWTSAPEIANYLVDKEDGYTHVKKTTERLLFKCPKCGYEEYKIPINIFDKNGQYICNRCRDGISYPEKFFINFLEQLNIDFVYQFSKTNANWVSNYLYDFFLSNYNIILEIHGEQHYKGFNYCKSADEIQENDNNKYNLAIKYVNEYIVIDARNSTMNYIKESILNSKLAEIFDLSTINWEECAIFASNSLLIKSCELWKDGFSVGQISNQLHLCKATIFRYLREGTNIGICNYTSLESYHRTQKDNINVA